MKKFIPIKFKLEKGNEAFRVIDIVPEEDVKRKLKYFLMKYSSLGQVIKDVVLENNGEALSYIYEVNAQVNMDDLVEKIINIYPEGGDVEIDVEMSLKPLK